MKTLMKLECQRCHITNIINPNIVHGEEGDPFAWHCTYCTARLN